MSGAVKEEYRLSIEGFGLQAVTHPDMEQTISSGAYNGVQRIVGLKRDSLVISEEVDIARAEAEMRGMQVQIVDRHYDRIWTEYFASTPAQYTWLDADVTGLATTFTVLSSAGFSSGDILHIGTECVRVVTVPDATSMTVDRGQWGTITQYHYSDDGEKLRRPRLSLTYTPTLEGRRAYLYRYVRGTDSLTGDGTLIWRGVVSTDAKLVGGSTWTLTIDPIIKLLDQDIGGSLEEPFKIRGIYYPDNASPNGGYGCRFRIKEMPSADVDATGAHQNTLVVDVKGFFETQDEFIAEVNSQLDTGVSGWTNGTTNTAQSIRCRQTSDGGWEIVYRTANSSPSALRLKDNTTKAARLIDGLDEAYAAEGVTGSVSANTDYVLCRSGLHSAGMPGAGKVPRGSFGSDRGRDGTASFSFSPYRLYLDSPIDLSNSDLVIKWQGEEERIYVGPTWNNVDKFMDMQRVLGDGLRSQRWFAADSQPEIKPTVNYGAELGELLSDFRDYLVTNSDQYANKGEMPFVTISDLASWTTEVEAAAETRPLARRAFTGTGSFNLLDFIVQECRLLGLYPALDSSGKIRLRSIDVFSGVGSADHTITAIRTSEGVPTWERNALGSINTWTLKTGWNPYEEDYTGPEFQIRDVTAFSDRKAPKELVIEPKSQGTVSTDGIRYEDVVSMAQPVLSLFGRPYVVIEVPVGRSDIESVLVGDVVSLDVSYIPSLTGVRGFSSAGIVIGREWRLGTGAGKLKIILADDKITGYSPSAYITSQSNTSGTTWLLTVSGSFMGTGNTMWPSGTEASDFFEVGDSISIRQVGTSSGIQYEGTVTSLGSTNNITVTLDGTWSPGSFDWVLEFSDAADTDIQQDDERTLPGQNKYAWQASSAARIAFNAGEEPAQEYS